MLLHLLRAAVARLLGPDAAARGLAGVTTFFFEDPGDFPEVVAFTRATDARYSLEMATLEGGFKAGVAGLLARRPALRAIVIGTRRGDPNAGGQEAFCPSSPGWPPFMRVNPVLDWSYGDVWAFLRAAGLEYCALYDCGYTSLGAAADTRPNPALARPEGGHAPAHALPDARLERAGRGAAAAVRHVPSLAALDARTAALVVVGDEVLSAKVADSALRFVAAELRALGWRLERAAFVRDSVPAIAAEVRAASAAHDVVLTVGGLGPTPDDVTMRGVAEALGRAVARSPELAARIRGVFGADTGEAHLKLAEVPTGGEVALHDCAGADGRPSPWPLVQVRNVYVLPGVPELLRVKWRAVRARLEAAGADGGPPTAPFRSVLLRLRDGDEARVAAALEDAAAAGAGEVEVGSYLLTAQSDGCELVLSLEAKSEAALETARAALLARLPSGCVASEHRDEDGALNSPAAAPTLGAAGSLQEAANGGASCWSC